MGRIVIEGIGVVGLESVRRDRRGEEERLPQPDIVRGFWWGVFGGAEGVKGLLLLC